MTDVRTPRPEADRNVAAVAAVRTATTGAVRVRPLLLTCREVADKRPLFASALGLPSLLLLGLALLRPSAA